MSSDHHGLARHGEGGPPRLVTLTFNRRFSDSDMEALRLAAHADGAVQIPPRVERAYALAQHLGFNVSSRPEVGQLIAVLAAMVKPGGRILEMGTGLGAGLGWIVHGLSSRVDVEVMSVEQDSANCAHVRSMAWPPHVRVEQGNCWEAVKSSGIFDLIFVDVPGKETYDLSGPIAALCDGGCLIIDDVLNVDSEGRVRRDRLTGLRDQILHDRDLLCANLAFSSGVLLVTKQRNSSPS